MSVINSLICDFSRNNTNDRQASWIILSSCTKRYCAKRRALCPCELGILIIDCSAWVGLSTTNPIPHSDSLSKTRLSSVVWLAITTVLICSNGKDSGGVEALKIEGEAEIHGELKSAGSIAIPTTIKGNPLQYPNSQPEEMPAIKVCDYDPESRPSLQRLSKDSYDSEKTFSGFAKYSGSQVTFEKGVKLDHGVLYVDGDLVIDGRRTVIIPEYGVNDWPATPPVDDAPAPSR